MLISATPQERSVEFKRGLRKLDPRDASPCMLQVCRAKNRDVPQMPAMPECMKQSTRKIEFLDYSLQRLGVSI